MQTPDVLVIGGGVIGCATALRLAQARLRVLVIDRGEPGAEASSAAAGMLAPQGETLEPDAFFKLCAASRDLYPTFVAEVEALSGRRVGYHRGGTVLAALNDEEYRILEAVWFAQSRAGLPLERLKPSDLSKTVPGLSPEFRAALFIPGDHAVDNELLCGALVDAGRNLGVDFEIGTEVKKLNVHRQRVESVEVGRAGRQGQVSNRSAGHFVLAAGCWSGDLAAGLGAALAMEPCRGQMIEFDCQGDFPYVVRSGHHYLVPRPPGRVLAGTTSEYVGFDKAVTADGLRSILEGTLRLAPVARDFRLRRAWAGLRPDTADHLPILGYGELENLVFATGHFRNGILLAPLTAQLVSELLVARSTSHALDAYHPLRFARPAVVAGPSATGNPAGSPRGCQNVA